MQIERDELCRIIEGSAPIRDELTGIPLGSQVEALADKIIAALSARPAVGEDVVERVGYGDGDMRGYGFAAYCAGWKAAVAAMQDPDNGVSECHARDYFLANPPKPTPDPVWRVPQLAIAAMGSDMGKGGRIA